MSILTQPLASASGASGREFSLQQRPSSAHGSSVAQHTARPALTPRGATIKPPAAGTKSRLGTEDGRWRMAIRRRSRLRQDLSHPCRRQQRRPSCWSRLLPPSCGSLAGRYLGIVPSRVHTQSLAAVSAALCIPASVCSSLVAGSPTGCPGPRGGAASQPSG